LLTGQKVLAVPRAYARRLVGLPDSKQAAKILQQAMIELLEDLKDLPRKVIDPRWIDQLDEES
jgi:hypothetical protein